MKYILKNAELLDTANEYISADVAVEDGVITAIGAGLDEAGAETLDLAGCTLMPGFIDAHVHVAVQPEYFDEAMRAWAVNGVTTVRELGMLCANSVESFAEFLESKKDDPACARVVMAGKYIDVDGGYGCGPNPAEKVGIIIETAEQAADAVSYQHGAGSTGIKIGIMEGGPMGGPRPRLTPEMVEAICTRAHEHGMWVTVHLSQSDTIAQLIPCGIDEAAHTPNDPIPDAVIADMVANNVSMITTVGDPDSFMPPPPGMAPEGFDIEAAKAETAQNRRNMIDSLGRFHRAGGKIAIGTDLIFTDDFMRDAVIPVVELNNLLKAGLSFMDAFRCGTITAAELVGTAAEEGSIEVGKRANLIAVRGRLDGSFEKLRAPGFVMNRGAVLKNAL